MDILGRRMGLLPSSQLACSPGLNHAALCISRQAMVDGESWSEVPSSDGGRWRGVSSFVKRQEVIC